MKFILSNIQLANLNGKIWPKSSLRHSENSRVDKVAIEGLQGKDNQISKVGEQRKVEDLVPKWTLAKKKLNGMRT